MIGTIAFVKDWLVTLQNEQVGGISHKKVTLQNEQVGGISPQKVTLQNEQVGGINHKKVTLQNEQVGGISHNEVPSGELLFRKVWQFLTCSMEDTFKLKINY